MDKNQTEEEKNEKEFLIEETVKTLSIDDSKYNVFRLDGHGFSKLTKKYCKKPFDDDFSDMMSKVAMELFSEFNFKFGFVGSDEISLVFIPFTEEEKKNKKELPFGGRQFKIISLLSGLASTIFTNLMLKKKNKEIEEMMKKSEAKEKNEKAPIGAEEKEKKYGIAYFDCRHFEFDTEEEMKKNLKFRQVCTIKNSKMMFAQHYLSHKDLQNVPSGLAIKKVLDCTKHDWNKEVNGPCQHGQFLRRVKQNLTRTMPDNTVVSFTRNKPQFTDSFEECFKKDEEKK